MSSSTFSETRNITEYWALTVMLTGGLSVLGKIKNGSFFIRLLSPVDQTDQTLSDDCCGMFFMCQLLQEKKFLERLVLSIFNEFELKGS